MMDAGGKSLQDCRRAMLKVVRSSFGSTVRAGGVGFKGEDGSDTLLLLLGLAETENSDPY